MLVAGRAGTLKLEALKLARDASLHDVELCNDSVSWISRCYNMQISRSGGRSTGAATLTGKGLRLDYILDRQQHLAA